MTYHSRQSTFSEHHRTGQLTLRLAPAAGVFPLRRCFGSSVAFSSRLCFRFLR